MVSIKKSKKNVYIFFYFSSLGKTDMELGKNVAIFIENGTKENPLLEVPEETVKSGSIVFAK